MSTIDKSKAGKRSGYERAGQATMRRFLVQCAFERLKPTEKLQPFSLHSLRALEEELRKPVPDEWVEDWNPYLKKFVRRGLRHPPLSSKAEQILDEVMRFLAVKERQSPSESPRQMSRDTLIKDLKALRIRSKRRTQRPG